MPGNRRVRSTGRITTDEGYRSSSSLSSENFHPFKGPSRIFRLSRLATPSSAALTPSSVPSYLHSSVIWSAPTGFHSSALRVDRHLPFDDRIYTVAVILHFLIYVVPIYVKILWLWKIQISGFWRVHMFPTPLNWISVCDPYVCDEWMYVFIYLCMYVTMYEPFASSWTVQRTFFVSCINKFTRQRSVPSEYEYCSRGKRRLSDVSRRISFQFPPEGSDNFE